MWSREAAQRAIQMLDNYEIRPGKFIGVCVSLDNCRLFIGSIPKDKRKDEIMEEMMKVRQLSQISCMKHWIEVLETPQQNLEGINEFVKWFSGLNQLQLLKKVQ